LKVLGAYGTVTKSLIRVELATNSMGLGNGPRFSFVATSGDKIHPAWWSGMAKGGVALCPP
jgi:hypothetical protein